MIDAFNPIDPKTFKLKRLKAKVVSAQDPVHKKALEMVTDFAKAGTYPPGDQDVCPGNATTGRFLIDGLELVPNEAED